MTHENPTSESISYPSGFISSFLPAVASFGSNSRSFQSSFPVVTSKSIALDGSGSDVIVLNVGSRYLKLGLANQAFPISVPHVIAKPYKCPEIQSVEPRNEWLLDEEEIQDQIQQRYRQARKKPPPNVYQSLTNYNRQVDFEEISAHNDAFLLDWTDVGNNSPKTCFVGLEALHLNPKLAYRLFWPLRQGQLNGCQYRHAREAFEDMGLLWRLAIQKELSIEPQDFSKFCLVLVVPDGFGRVESRGCLDALLRGQRPFKAVTIVQESQAVTFGCGVSSALVLDIGAQKSSLACVDEGFLVPESRIWLPFGGDDLTRIFAQLLRNHEFPYEFELNQPLDWELMDELKERCCTLNEGEIALSATIFEFFVRNPDALTKKFLFKMFEERIIAPLSLFASEIPWLMAQNSAESEIASNLAIDAFDLEDPFTSITSNAVVSDENAEMNSNSNLNEDSLPSAPIVADAESLVPQSIVCNWMGCGESIGDLNLVVEHFQSSHLSEDGVVCKISGCKFRGVDSLSLLCHILSAHYQPASSPTGSAINGLSNVLPKREFTAMPIDEAAQYSFLQLGDSERIKRCASSIILAGGCQLIPGLPEHFIDSLVAKLPLNPSTALVEAKLFPNTRDFDARWWAWKGGAVFSKLDSSMDSWITRENWEQFGMRSAKEKITFLN